MSLQSSITLWYIERCGCLWPSIRTVHTVQEPRISRNDESWVWKKICYKTSMSYIVSFTVLLVFLFCFFTTSSAMCKECERQMLVLSVHHHVIRKSPCLTQMGLIFRSVLQEVRSQRIAVLRGRSGFPVCPWPANRGCASTSERGLWWSKLLSLRCRFAYRHMYCIFNDTFWFRCKDVIIYIQTLKHSL